MLRMCCYRDCTMQQCCRANPTVMLTWGQGFPGGRPSPYTPLHSPSLPNTYHRSPARHNSPMDALTTAPQDSPNATYTYHRSPALSNSPLHLPPLLSTPYLSPTLTTVPQLTPYISYSYHHSSVLPNSPLSLHHPSTLPYNAITLTTLLYTTLSSHYTLTPCTNHSVHH